MQTELTQDDRNAAKIREMREANATLTQIAKALKMCRRTAWKYINDLRAADADVGPAFKRGQPKRKIVLSKTLEVPTK